MAVPKKVPVIILSIYTRLYVSPLFLACCQKSKDRENLILFTLNANFISSENLIKLLITYKCNRIINEKSEVISTVLG